MKVLTTNEVRSFVTEEELRNRLDPAGKHVTYGPQLLHNDTHIRTNILLKLRGKGPNEPTAYAIDIPLELWNIIPEYKGKE